MIIGSALLAKIIAGATMASLAGGVYVASRAYEKGKNWREVMTNNEKFKGIYENPDVYKPMRESGFKDQVEVLKKLLESEIITKDEFLKLIDDLMQ